MDQFAPIVAIELHEAVEDSAFVARRGPEGNRVRGQAHPVRIGGRMKHDPAIDEYLAGVSPKSRALLQMLRKTIHALVPDVEECLSYRLPAFRFEGKLIAGFSATSKGCSYYPFSGTTLKTLASDIEGYGERERCTVLRVGGLGGCFGRSDYDRNCLHGYAKRHYTREEIERLSTIRGVDVMLVHDVPAGVRFEQHRQGPGWVSDAAGLDDLLARTEPRVCFFGHHHQRLDGEVSGVRCVGLDKVGRPGNLVACGGESFGGADARDR
jgi:uncharacterized protein YdhG (YjbR/CyaY superfamily)